MFTRGRPDDATIHLRISQQRRGMVEGTDYATQVACHTDNYHIHYTNHVSDVTCDKCREVGRVNAWNRMVDDVIRKDKTFTFQTPNGTLAIELGTRGMKEMKYVAWMLHDDSVMVYGATPHEAYSDCCGSSHEN